MNLMRYSHSKGTRLFQTILWNIEQKHSAYINIKPLQFYYMLSRPHTD